MIEILARLGSARNAKHWLEAEIKKVEAPHLAAAKAASAQLRPLLAAAKTREETENAAARGAYTTASEARRQALLAGHEAPGIELPDGWIVQQRTGVEIVEPGKVPRNLCIPDTKAVAEALKGGAQVPGAQVVIVPVFVHQKEKTCSTSK